MTTNELYFSPDMHTIVHLILIQHQKPAENRRNGAWASRVHRFPRPCLPDVGAVVEVHVACGRTVHGMVYGSEFNAAHRFQRGAVEDEVGDVVVVCS
ncbi:hypothetical protein Y032_0272g910 [Ancylostoma ceylanicum]|uniref:Uncharacterized protein n=1 Tax=Ancylostoma ceylanicum TaxID=53326 RepID=A0A016S8W6_9BILA|nr:hypothetical protein Y032_0272g910 [Ancylostoma ceylanicum]